MANTTFRNIQDNTLALISKSDSTTRNRVSNWINMGYQDFVNRELWPFREATHQLTLTQGTQEYDLAAEISDIDQQNIISVALQGESRRKLPYIPFNQLRASKPDFDEDAESIPQSYYLKAGKIGFWPIPNAGTEVAIDYYVRPTELVNDSDEPIIPVGYREALMQYALSLEHDFNTDPDLAQKASNRYEQIVALARNNLLSQPVDTGNFRVLGPADSKSWTGLQGDIR
jgi:hypothetical protein